MRTDTYITTSWDDGHPLDLRVAEMLSRHGLRGTFYIPRKIESGVMSREQMQKIASQFEIGAHTINHVFLTSTDIVTARKEINDSKAWVEDVTGTPCTMFCPPAGKFTDHHARMVRDAGYTGLRSVEFMSLDLPRSRNGILEMPTTVQAFNQSVIGYAKNFARRLALRNAWSYILHGHSTDWTALSRAMLKRALSGGGVFHLWGHSWELESEGQWKRLEDVLRLLGEVNRQAVCLTNGQVCARMSSVDVPLRGAAVVT